MYSMYFLLTSSGALDHLSLSETADSARGSPLVDVGLHPLLQASLLHSFIPKSCHFKAF